MRRLSERACHIRCIQSEWRPDLRAGISIEERATFRESECSRPEAAPRGSGRLFPALPAEAVRNTLKFPAPIHAAIAATYERCRIATDRESSRGSRCELRGCQWSRSPWSDRKKRETKTKTRNLKLETRNYPPPFFNCCFHPSTRAFAPSSSASGIIPFF